jgi:RND family efflux transporter MFP subunit
MSRSEPDPAGLARSADPREERQAERAAGQAAATGLADPAHGASRIPMPAFRWATRVMLPMTILVCTGGLLAVSAGRAWLPATDVYVVPAMPAGATNVDDAENEPPPAAGRESGGVVTQAPGWIEPAPYPIAVSALIDGVVLKVHALEGEHVSSGQRLVSLVDDDARLAQARAQAARDQAKAAAATARAMLVAATTTWEAPFETDRRAATADAELAEAMAALARWPSDLATAEAMLGEMKAELKRLDRLYEGDEAADIEFIRARQREAAQAARVEAIRAGEAILKARVGRAAAEQAAAAQNAVLRIDERRALDAGRAEAQRADAALAQAEAALDEAKLALSRTQIASPITGIVMRRYVEPGSKVMRAGDVASSAWVMRLYRPDRLQVRVDVPLADAAKIFVDQPAEVVVNALPDAVFRGRVTRIVHEADVQKNTVQAKVEIDSPSAHMVPEMLARVRFLTAGGRDRSGGGAAGDSGGSTLIVPERLIDVVEHGGARVWVVESDTARWRAVTIGSRLPDARVEILSGLRQGDRLIVPPEAGLNEGERVRVVGEADGDLDADEFSGGRSGDGANGGGR